MTDVPESNRLLLPVTERIRDEIFRADRAWAVWKMTADFAQQINADNFGDLFGSLQGALLDQFTLSLTKLYEAPNSRYPILSIRTALEQLDQLASVLEIQDRPRLLRWVRSATPAGQDLGVLGDSELTRMLASSLRMSLPSLDQAESCEISRALEAHRTRRDKSVAHPEAVSAEQLPKTTWKASLSALATAKHVLNALGWSYLRIAYADDKGDYFLASDAERAAYALRRLLRRAGIAPNRQSPAA